MDKSILEIKDLSIQYNTDNGTVKAVNNLNMSIGEGEVLGLVGETGAGKTSTALSVMGLLPIAVSEVKKGEILFYGQDLLRLAEKEMRDLRGNNISMIFQDPMTSLNPVMKVGKQIAESFVKHRGDSWGIANKKAKEMLEIVGIPKGRANEYPHQFSGGMRQRVMIALALACNPKLLIADEPTTALDVTIQAQILDLIQNLLKEFNMSVLLITHDLGVVAEICDRVSVMYAGRIIETGNLADIFNNRKHPYTVGLFNSLPNVEDRFSPLEPIKGEMPDPMNIPEGCPFHPRCEKAMNICEKELPTNFRLNDTHEVACHLYF